MRIISKTILTAVLALAPIVAGGATTQSTDTLLLQPAQAGIKVGDGSPTPAETVSTHGITLTRSVLMPDGRIFFLGYNDNPRGFIFDRNKKVWSRTAKMIRSDGTHVSVSLLEDGRLFVLGLHGAEIYDPQKDLWKEVAPSTYRRFQPTVTPLKDGKVLVLGGTTNLCERGECSSDYFATNLAEIYDPRVNKWTKVPGLLNPLANHYAVRLTSGNVMVYGGNSMSSECLKKFKHCSSYASMTVQIFDPTTLKWTVKKDFPHAGKLSGNTNYSGPAGSPLQFISADLFMAVQTVATPYEDNLPCLIVYSVSQDSWTEPKCYRGRRFFKVQGNGSEGLDMLMIGDPWDLYEHGQVYYREFNSDGEISRDTGRFIGETLNTVQAVYSDPTNQGQVLVFSDGPTKLFDKSAVDFVKGFHVPDERF